MRFKFAGEDLEIVHEVLGVEVKTYVKDIFKILDNFPVGYSSCLHKAYSVWKADKKNVKVYYVVDKTTKHANDMHFVLEIDGRYYNHISSKKRIAFKDIFAFKNGRDEEWDKINLNCFYLVPILGGDVVD